MPLFLRCRFGVSYLIACGAYHSVVERKSRAVLVGQPCGEDFHPVGHLHRGQSRVPEGIAAQTAQSCKNVGAILEAAGSGFDKVIKTTCFLAEIADFAAFNEVYAEYFTSKPARSCFAVKDLPKGVLCEIECIAEA